jgi:pantoate--beta-alanine ligase
MQHLAQRWKREGVRVAFVPTMGFLHAGHLTLMQKARNLVGSKGKVVVSIYVNPTQFGPREDFRNYPRDLSRDKRRCAEIGVDVAFVPSDAEMYPGRDVGMYSTYVVEEALSGGMEGTSRPSHFRGVTTVVAKLFNLVLPDIALFGSKDFQQAAVIRRMVRDLHFPVRVVVMPTVRDSDGLAISSRNKYLNPAQRRVAGVLHESLREARRFVRQESSGMDAGPLRRKLKTFIEKHPGTRVDYVEFFHPETFELVKAVRSGHQMALAVFVGKTRLIDNGRL